MPIRGLPYGPDDRIAFRQRTNEQRGGSMDGISKGTPPLKKTKTKVGRRKGPKAMPKTF